MKQMKLIAITAAALLAGCGNGEKTVRYADLKDRDVVVRVGDTDVIKAKFEKGVFWGTDPADAAFYKGFAARNRLPRGMKLPD